MSPMTALAPLVSALEYSCGMPGPMRLEIIERIWPRSLPRRRRIAFVWICEMRDSDTFRMEPISFSVSSS